MQLSGRELAALLKMCFNMAAADGKFAEEEKAIITVGLLQFGLGKDEIKVATVASERMEPVEAISVLSSMDTTQKKYATGLLAAVMASDGDIDDSEVKMWQLICTLCNFPTMSIADALTYWKNN